MAANDPGLAPAANPAEDPTKGAVEIDKDGHVSDDERLVAPDQFDERYQTGKWEIWAYCALAFDNDKIKANTTKTPTTSATTA